MLAAPIPINEAVRLEALLSYQVLDSAPESSYDDLTRLASAICQAPIALVSLVDSERQWFKSRRGLDATETPRDVSFCGHAIHQAGVFVVDDADIDPRFSDNPLVTGGPRVKFYAGVPLLTSEGLAIGTLCVIDHRPRQLTAEQAELLECLSRHVIVLLELRKADQALGQKLGELQEATRTLAFQQESLTRAAKMSSLGEIAGGVAHEVNNPVAIIHGTARQARSKFAAQPEVAASFQIIEVAVGRIAKIIRGLMTFARDGGQDPMQPLNLAEVVEDTLVLCREKIAMHRVKLSVDPVPAGISGLVGRPVQLSQVLLNVIANALDAVSAATERWIRIRVEAAPAAVHIIVSDSGTGIAPAMREQIMQAFFTTKAAGTGMGLGLSLSRSIMQAHGGTLELDPQAADTSFVISLPRKPSAIAL